MGSGESQADMAALADYPEKETQFATAVSNRSESYLPTPRCSKALPAANLPPYSQAYHVIRGGLQNKKQK